VTPTDPAPPTSVHVKAVGSNWQQFQKGRRSISVNSGPLTNQ
jgi:hypothetical protein